MGLTRAQADTLGLGHLYPDAPAAPIVRPAASAAPDDGMNATERRFAGRLEDLSRRGVLRAWYREPIKLRIAGRCWYTPDFLADWGRASSRMTFFEVKGFMRDDACVKIKAAADRYPMFDFLLAYHDRRAGWTTRRVTRTGIGPVTPWTT